MGGRFDDTVCQESPPSSLIQSDPVVEPKASRLPVSSTSNPWRYTRSYACSCGNPRLSVSNVFPPSLVRLTTTRPSVGQRFSSFVEGTNQAVLGSFGCTATAKPNTDGFTSLISVQVSAASVD